MLSQIHPMSEIKIVENTSEIAAGTRGASLGVGALKVVAHNTGSDFFGRYERFIVENENEILNEPTEFNYAKRIDGLVNVYRNTMDVVSHILNEGDFPLILAGDHASAGGTIAGIKKAYPDKRLGVVWIDAHADLHTPYTTPSGNIHGMPLATAVNEDNLEYRINDPKPETVEFWENLKNMGGIAPKVNPSDIVFIAVRDTEGPEDAYIEQVGIRNFTVEEIRQKKPFAIADEVKVKLHECDIVYVSFDVDSMDCDIVSRGTGTPVKNGLTPEEATEFMIAFSAWEKTCCVEVVEINPCLDDKINKMAETAFEIIEKFTPEIEKQL